MDVNSEGRKERDCLACFKPFNVKVGRSEDLPTPRSEHGGHMNSGAWALKYQNVA